MEDSKSRISLIIPVYNVEHYLKECLNSVLDQTYKNLEIICINDGSTDSSLKILENYAKYDRRVVILNQNNQGQGAARNRGIEISTGEYIFFLDADDYIMPDTIEYLHNKILETKSDIAVVKAKAFADDDSEETLKRTAKMEEWLDKFVMYNYQMTVQNYRNNIDNLNCTIWGKLYKKSFIEDNNLRFIENQAEQEDIGFWMKLCASFPNVTYTDYTGLMYRIRSDSTMALSTPKSQKTNIMKCIKDVFSYIDKYQYRCSTYLKNQIKMSDLYTAYSEKQLGFLYRQRWAMYNKAIVIMGIPLYREKIQDSKKIIRIMGIPVYRKNVPDIALLDNNA